MAPRLRRALLEELTMNRSRLAFAAMVVAAAVSAVQAIGCIGGCGVGPVDGPNSQDGTVMFGSVEVGETNDLPIPFQDSADVDETITGASFEGVDASEFSVKTTFPLFVPAGQQGTVTIEFSPTHVGDATATLILQTAGMGPSPVPLEGTATTPESR
jgi:hypothetical protein